MRTHVAVAIVGYNNITDIQKCIAALSKSTYSDFEVLSDPGGATGDVVVFLGDGAIPDPRWLEELA